MSSFCGAPPRKERTAGEDTGADGRGGARRGSDGAQQPLVAEQLAAEAGGLGDAVRVEHQHVAVVHDVRRLLERGALAHAERRLRRGVEQRDAAAGLAQRRLRVAGVRDRDLAGGRVERRQQQRDEHRLVVVGRQRGVDPLQDRGRLALPGGGIAQLTAQLGDVERGRDTLARDVADRQPDAAVGQLHEVVVVAADRQRRRVLDGEAQPGHLGRAPRQEVPLDAARQHQVALEQLLLQQLAVQARVRHRHRQLPRDGEGQRHVRRAERQRPARAVHLDHAVHPVVGQHRHADQRAHAEADQRLGGPEALVALACRCSARPCAARSPRGSGCGWRRSARPARRGCARPSAAARRPPPAAAACRARPAAAARTDGPSPSRTAPASSKVCARSAPISFSASMRRLSCSTTRAASSALCGASACDRASTVITIGEAGFLLLDQGHRDLRRRRLSWPRRSSTPSPRVPARARRRRPAAWER